MSENKKIYFLNSEILPEISEVGGKGHSLIRLSTLNLNVPNGIVLTVNFFNEWINKIKETNLYQQFVELLKENKNIDDCFTILNQIKEWCLNNLVLTKEEIQNIEQSLESIFPNECNKLLYAVRSSSPEEDLFGASFAGNYETYLGIKFDCIEKYILKSFISCLDFRVIKYKLEKGFDVTDVKIAIVIMKQINCDASGVGFSINPMNNDSDEAVVTSNFGLGESVVGGITTPDEYIVNKLSKKVVSKNLGAKDKIVKLNTGDNETTVIEQTEENKNLSSLTENILMEIVNNIIVIEKHYKIPVDIEFGIENNILYILQARPITTYNKIPEELSTKENEKRQLYFDMTLAVQGLEKPMSTLGASIFRVIKNAIFKTVFKSTGFDDIKKNAADGVGGKLLFNISNIMTKVPKDILVNLIGNMNKQASNILGNIGEEYKNEKVCQEINISLIGLLFRLPLKRIIFYKYYGPSSKENLEIAFKKYVSDYDTYIKDNLNSNVPITTIVNTMITDLVLILRDKFVPVMFPAMAKGFLPLNKIFDENFKDKSELKEDMNNLTRSLPFITVIMGLDLYKLTTYLDKNEYLEKSQEEFYQDFLNKKFPKEFYEEYEIYIKKYGFRCEGELDIKNERTYENPKPLINQIYSTLLMYDENNNPQKDYDETNANRPKVFEKIQKQLKNKKDKDDFEKAYNNVINYFYHRETHKYYIIYALSKIKELILERVKPLVERNLIDDVHDIYKFNLNSLNTILNNIDEYTKEQVSDQIKKDNEANEIFNSWSRYPLLFDSRGKMFSPERKHSDKKNELIGDSVSYGKIRGKAKVLNSVHEKEFNPGEILITKATDPGWTPLIINCGGIALEVGGMLQHGALVSREFNKPCVVGIDNLTSIIKDGEEVEIDAIEGVVRLLDREE